MKLTTLAFIQRLLAKLNEKSSVYGYAMLFAGAFAEKYQGAFAQGAAMVSATAGIALFVLSDAQVKAWLTGHKPDSQIRPTVPPPKEG
ncbi:MAG: hypothetical protein WAM90_15745 [Rhodanobacter sp.]